MTANQLAYQANLETQRANRAKEAEAHRSNLAKEAETNRSNLATEKLTMRRDFSKEPLNYGTILYVDEMTPDSVPTGGSNPTSIFGGLREFSDKVQERWNMLPGNVPGGGIKLTEPLKGVN